MTKGSCILYSEIDLGENSVECVYLFKDECRAQPIVEREIGFYKVNEDDVRRFCKSTAPSGFRTCPRAMLYHEHLKAIGLEKRTT